MKTLKRGVPVRQLSRVLHALTRTPTQLLVVIVKEADNGAFPFLSLSANLALLASMAMVVWLGRSRGGHRFGKRALKSLETSTKIQFCNQNSVTEEATPKCSSGSLRNLLGFCSAKRLLSTRAGESVSPQYDEPNNRALDFPGGKLMFVPEMRFLSESPADRVNCYRILDDDGETMPGSRFEEVTEEIAVKMYSNMVTLQIMDTLFYEAQRQGRISFYLTSYGEEAINVASAAALTNDDLVFPQLPQAVGAAYSLKMDKKDACVITYFGDGGTSEGDFHAALNFAAVMEVPVIFFCRNNGWAISTPITDQFRSDGVVVRGQAYGIRSIRVDGNDALAVYSAVRVAREMAIRECRPILVEALTYRVGHHSTSDDSTKYRSVDEIEHWRTARDPVSRYRKWVETNGWWSDADESELRSKARKEVLQAIQGAERLQKPPLSELFTDVYDTIPSNLSEQEKSLRETIKNHPGNFPSDVPLLS